MIELPALSIMQPWPWLIVNGWKPVENRSWSTNFRGRFSIHAGKKFDEEAMDALLRGEHPVTGDFDDLDEAIRDAACEQYPEISRQRGGIVGEAELVDCVTAMNSEWFVGEYGFVVRDAKPVPFRPCRGQLGFFIPDFGPQPPKAEQAPPAQLGLRL